MSSSEPDSFDQFDRMYNDITKAHFWSARAQNAFDVIPLQTIRKMDSGVTGDVLLMRTKPHEKVKQHLFLAAKVFTFEEDESRMAWFLREAGIMQSLQHTNIVKCFAPVFSFDCGILLMDFIPDGSLVSHIGSIREEDVHRYFVQIACALRYIHSQRIAHRDIKPENIMIRKQSAVIIDFGLSLFLPCEDCASVRGIAGTKQYMAPELRHGTEDTVYDAVKSDSFSLGVVLWCMMLQKLPTLDTKFTPFVFPKKMDSILTFCMRRLLRTDPGLRFDVAALLRELSRRGYSTKMISSL